MVFSPSVAGSRVPRCSSKTSPLFSGRETGSPSSRGTGEIDPSRVWVLLFSRLVFSVFPVEMSIKDLDVQGFSGCSSGFGSMSRTVSASVTKASMDLYSSKERPGIVGARRAEDRALY